MSKLLRLLITVGDQEEVIAVLTREQYPNELGEIVPPVTIEHGGKEYILKRKWMEDVYVYKPSMKKEIDDFLAGWSD